MSVVVKVLRLATLGVAGTLIATQALACRCAPRTLAEYYGDADEVVFARLVSETAADHERRLVFSLVTVPFKASALRSDGLSAGDEVTYLTGASSASCGLEAVPDGVYVLFAADDPTRTGERLVSTCDGSRVHLAEGDVQPLDFKDVPARFVVKQLQALAGMDVLRDVSANAPNPAEPGNDSLIGLLDIKALAHGGVVPLHADPDARAPCIARISELEALETREAGYEFSAAVVTAKRDGWYRVRLASGAAGWVAQEFAGTWFPYEELPIRRLSYLTGEWSGFVWPGPGAGLPNRSGVWSSQQRAEYPVEVHESQQIGGMVWFRVSVLVASPCAGGDGKATLSGWVPGYGATGKPNVWFYSRGC
ncbi:MAG: hypothetical protein AAFN78_09025 [Pseudomonadota bacterium]